MKKILILLLISITLTGCKNLLGWGGDFWSSIFDTDTVESEFVTDNDTVFDLFQDDFGTGTQYDDRFTDDGSTDTQVDSPNTAANDPGPPVSTIKDPAYDEIAKMTPDELSALGILTIPVLLVSGAELPFPAKQFGDLSGKDKCDYAHYHGSSGFSMDLKNIPQPDTPCGFGNKVTQRTVTGWQMIDWFNNRPRNF